VFCLLRKWKLVNLLCLACPFIVAWHDYSLLKRTGFGAVIETPDIRPIVKAGSQI